MNEQQALAKMISPGMRREGKLGGFGGVIQVIVTSNCNLSCFSCTQGSQLQQPKRFMTVEQFRQAVESLRDYFGVVGVFGGNPAMSPLFIEYCSVLREVIPFERRGLWCNDLLTAEKGHAARITFNPAVSNLNCHLSQSAFDGFRSWWPESHPFGLHEDSRHSPPFVAMKDVLKKSCPRCKGTGNEDAQGIIEDPVRCRECHATGKVYDEERAWDLISNCDINRHWSAGIGVFRGQLRGWFCEIAMAQSILHQDEPNYPDTGLDPTTDYDRLKWWQLPMSSFSEQVRLHCHSCGIPLRGYGELAQSSSQESREQVSETHVEVYKPKRQGRRVELVTIPEQLGKPLDSMVRYIQNSHLTKEQL